MTPSMGLRVSAYTLSNSAWRRSPWFAPVHSPADGHVYCKAERLGTAVNETADETVATGSGCGTSLPATTVPAGLALLPMASLRIDSFSPSHRPQ